MNKIEIYSKAYCPFCHRAKALLDAKGAQYQEIDVSRDTEKLAEMIKRSQRPTVPQIFIDGHHIGGSDDLMRIKQTGELDKLLGTNKQASALTSPQTAGAASSVQVFCVPAIIRFSYR